MWATTCPEVQDGRHVMPAEAEESAVVMVAEFEESGDVMPVEVDGGHLTGSTASQVQVQNMRLCMWRLYDALITAEVDGGHLTSSSQVHIRQMTSWYVEALQCPSVSGLGEAFSRRERCCWGWTEGIPRQHGRSEIEGIWFAERI